MHRFFFLTENKIEDQVTIIGEDCVHMQRVLRLQVGGKVELCDGFAHEYLAKIESITKQAIVLKIELERESETEPSSFITLFQGYPKGSKLETILQKGTEIGISEFKPFYSQFCDVKPSKTEKNDRYQRILYEAAKQCKRGIIPKFQAPISFKQLCEEIIDFDCVIVAYESEKNLNLRDISLPKRKRIALIVGPEGGFSEQEIAQLIEKNAKVVTLGKRILRTETAGIVLGTLVLYELGDMQ